MMNAYLFARPNFPKGIPTTADQELQLGKRVDAERNKPGHFEQDAFEYSGKRSQPLLPTAVALCPVVTTVLSADIKEDNSHQAYESMSGLLSSAGSAATQLAAAAAPVAGMAMMGITSLRNAVPSKSNKEG